MKNAIKLLTEEFKKNLEDAIATGAFKDVIKATKEAEDSGTFEVVISTADFDRSGESVDQAGWNLELYKMNPIVLWGHDYYSLPIGVCDSIELVEGKLIAKGRFAPGEANPFAQQVRKMYDAKIVRATSVGFIVEKMEGNIIKEAQLLEFSFVPVPANPYALSLRDAQSLGLDISMLAMKGLGNLTKKEEGSEEEVVEEETPEEETPAEETPAEEVVTPATEETPEEETVVEEKSISKKASDTEIEAVGAELATMQAAVATIMSESAIRIMDILKGKGEEVDEEESEPEEGDEKSVDGNDGDVPEDVAIETPEDGEDDVNSKEFKEFQMSRLVMRALATATTNALENFNKKSHEYERSRNK